jgi:hypothetical protein
LEVGRLYTRPRLAELWGYESFHAIARGVVTPREENVIVLFVTHRKQRSLTQYDDVISGDQLYWEGEKGHRTDERIARAHENGERIVLFYRDVHHTPFRYYGQVLLTRFRPREDEPSKFEFELVHDLSAEDDIESRAGDLAAVDAPEREQLVRARRGQGRFRAELISRWGRCAVTAVSSPELLRASHIKPWRFSSNAERLDPFNGLLLLPQYDHLFDRGYMTFEPTGEIRLSEAVSDLDPRRLGIDQGSRLRDLVPAHEPFLDYHRAEVFAG